MEFVDRAYSADDHVREIITQTGNIITNCVRSAIEGNSKEMDAVRKSKQHTKIIADLLLLWLHMLYGDLARFPPSCNGPQDSHVN